MNIETTNINDSSQPEEQDGQNSNSVYTGSEPIFSVFMQTQVNLQSVRMTIKGRVLHQVSDLVSAIEVARREFRHIGDPHKAMQDTKRIQAVYDQRVQDWNRTASGLERDKRGMSGQELQKMKAEHTRVRSSLNVLNRYFTKLEVELSQIAAMELTKSREENELEGNAETPLPPGQTGENERDDTNPASDDSAGGGHDRVEPPSQFPGNRVDLSIYSDLQPDRLEAFQTLHELIGENLSLGYHSATRKTLDDSQAREHAWDSGSRIGVVLRWMPIANDDWATSDLVIWLIPKAQQIYNEMLFLQDKIRFRLENDEQIHEISMTPRMPDAETTPRNKRISILVKKVMEKFGESKEFSFFALRYQLQGSLDSEFKFSVRTIESS